MLEQLLFIIKDNPKWAQLQDLVIERQIAAKTILLNEGEISAHAHVIKKGCLREWFNKDGKEITFQFFFEGQAVASIDSFLNNQPSLYTIESIESSIIYSISKDKFEAINQQFPEFKEKFQELMYQRFRNYANLFLSRIKDSPKERYEDLIQNNPQIIKRVPQHYIASYLGITPTSLSRIRNRK
jgi:CRP-like cAMP-binding protein